MRGAIYKGEYKTGDRAGWGEFVTADGDVYEGQWRHNVRHGKGVVTLAVADANLLAVEGDKGIEQRRWAEVWFKESPARPADQTGNALDIDPSRTFTGYWEKGKVVKKRPYRYEDWTDIQTNSTLAADNAGLAVEESQKAVGLARKAGEFAEEAARKAVDKMQSEAEEREAYLVHLGPHPQPRTVEDRHMVRMGPEVSRGTFLCMIGANKAEEMAANTAEIGWLAPVAASDADSQTSSAVQVPKNRPRLSHVHLMPAEHVRKERASSWLAVRMVVGTSCGSTDGCRARALGTRALHCAYSHSPLAIIPFEPWCA